MAAHADPEAIREHLAQSEGEAPEVVETHISWVFLTPTRAYKLKKPLVLPFLDYGSPERRRLMCSEELRLNRRLAPEVYLGVRSVVPGASGVRLGSADDPGAIDYVVEMNRYPAAETLATRLKAGQVSAADVRRVGTRLAQFHATCPVRGSAEGATRSVESEVDHNALELLDLLQDQEPRAQVRAAWRLLTAAVRARGEELLTRTRDGRVREAHGDVRLEHVLMTDPLQIVDCVEFDRDLRTIDVADELAFMVAELTEASVDWLTGPLLDGYREAGGNCGDGSLVAMFAVHRALVRAKVIRLAADEQSGPRRRELLDQCDRWLEVAERLSWRIRLPRTLVICGLPASGKSHLAEALGAASGLPVLSSDVVRKELFGRQPTDRAAPAAYLPEGSRRTYTELGRRALVESRQRAGAVVDATFRHLEDRQAFAGELRSRCMYVECVAPPEVLLARSRQRARDPQRISDATEEIVERSLTEWEPLSEISPADHMILRSDRSTAAMMADLAALLEARLEPGGESSQGF